MDTKRHTLPACCRLEFRDKHLTFIEIHGVRFWIAREVGRAMEYADDGKQLVKNVRQRWKKNFRIRTMADLIAGEVLDGIMLDGEDLQILKHLLKGGGNLPPPLSKEGPLKGAKSVLLLTQAGLWKSIWRAQTPEAREFENWLVDVALPHLEENGMALPKGDRPLTAMEMREKEEERRGQKELRLTLTALHEPLWKMPPGIEQQSVMLNQMELVRVVFDKPAADRICERAHKALSSSARRHQLVMPLNASLFDEIDTRARALSSSDALLVLDTIKRIGPDISQVVEAANTTPIESEAS